MYVTLQIARLLFLFFLSLRPRTNNNLQIFDPIDMRVEEVLHAWPKKSYGSQVKAILSQRGQMMAGVAR